MIDLEKHYVGKKRNNDKTGLGQKIYLKFFNFRGDATISPIPYTNTLDAEEAGDATCRAGFAATFELVTTATIAAAIAAAATTATVIS